MNKENHGVFHKVQGNIKISAFTYLLVSNNKLSSVVWSCGYKSSSSMVNEVMEFPNEILPWTK